MLTAKFNIHWTMLSVFYNAKFIIWTRWLSLHLFQSKWMTSNIHWTMCLFFRMQNSLFGHVDCLYIYSSPCWLTSQYSLDHVVCFCFLQGMQSYLFGHVGCLYIYSSPGWLTSSIFTRPCCLFLCKECKVDYSDNWLSLHLFQSMLTDDFNIH